MFGDTSSNCQGTFHGRAKGKRTYTQIERNYEKQYPGPGVCFAILYCVS